MFEIFKEDSFTWDQATEEMAPSQSTETMYLDKEGNVDNAKFNLSFHSIGVPGTVAGMVRALDQYGTMNLDEINPSENGTVTGP